MKAKRVKQEQPAFQPQSITITFESLEEVQMWKALIGAIGGCPDKTLRGVMNPDTVYNQLFDIIEELGADHNKTFTNYFVLQGYSHTIDCKKK